MNPNIILAAEIYPESTYGFIGLENLDLKSPEQKIVKCLTYRQELDTEKLRKTLREEALEIAGGKTIPELEGILRDYQLGWDSYEQELKRTSFRYFVNPFANGKEKSDRVISLVYFSPIVGLGIGAAGDITNGLLWGGLSLGGPILILEISRRSKKYEIENKIEKIRKDIADVQKKLKDPVLYYSRLAELSDKINIESVLVEDARNFINDVKRFKWLITDEEKAEDNINDGLEERYSKFLEENPDYF